MNNKGYQILEMKRSVLELFRTRPAGCDLGDEMQRLEIILTRYAEVVTGAQNKCHQSLSLILEEVKAKCGPEKK